MTRDAATGFARTLVDEWVRAGVSDASISPGSRSTPLALALANDRRVRLHVHLDERSAAFFALGLGKATGRPAIVLCTSGTAAANFHPAVLEAHHSRTPLLVCTADRPPELRRSGAGQTIDQVKLYGDAVRWFVDAEVPTDRAGVGASWRALAARAAAEALGPPAGPVHVNLAFREPLVPTGDALVDAPGRPDGQPWTRVTRAPALADDVTVERLAARVAETPNGVVVAGWGARASTDVVDRFARAAGWPVLADPLSNLRTGPESISTYDALLRDERFAATHRPQGAVRLGAPPTGRALNAWLDAHRVPQIVVDPDHAWRDPSHAATEVLAVEADPLLDAVTHSLRGTPASLWRDGWLDAERVARRVIDTMLDDDQSEPFEGRIARDVVGALPPLATLVVASSMPVRDVESFAAARHDIRFVANRGVSGIDGFVSTVLGIAAARESSDPPVVALCGDLCFLHDANGLLGAAARGIDATFLVVDNGGGGIFSFLPQANFPEHFESLFATPQAVDIGALAQLHGLAVHRVEKAMFLTAALDAAMRAGGVQVVLVRTGRAGNAARHDEVWQAVAGATDRS
jgi:2-succinyl-5-enolpyruvyl-6-hydroxy-3-cyclohexene-1-carboxylate synthase